MTKKSKKQIENQSQSGRSMVEMLGVLAIIAILSIGGIVGYKLAMNYYQADQIANEINLMRNDLKVKYALGNEELLLGDPYDDTPENEHYSGHLSTQYDRYPVDYDCIRKDKAEFYNCREADAYYIKVGNVSKGVCKPLTTLVSAMDGLMYMEINKQPYKEDDLCSSDEANEFYIQFDAEEVNGNYDSNRPEGWCGDNKDCEASRPICDIENNECVECIEHTDCKDLSKPRCNDELGNCESCPTATPIWLNNECVECTTNDDCLKKGTENPVCNTTQGKCEPCPEGESWKESAQGCAAYECRTNEDCNPDGGFEKYCYLGWGQGGENGCELEFSDEPGPFFSGHCQSVEGDSTGEIIISNEQTQTKTKYSGSQIRMNWWSACRFCAAKTHVSDSPCDSSTVSEPDFMADYSVLQCADSINIAAREAGYCHATSIGNTNKVASNISSVIVQLKTLFSGFSDNDVWLRNDYTGCRVANVRISNGLVHDTARGNGASHGVALCKGEEVR